MEYYSKKTSFPTDRRTVCLEGAPFSNSPKTPQVLAVAPAVLLHLFWVLSSVCPSTTIFLVRADHSNCPIFFSSLCHPLPSPNPNKMGKEKNLVGGDTGPFRATSTAHLSQSHWDIATRHIHRLKGRNPFIPSCGPLIHGTTLPTDGESTYKESFVWPKVRLFHCFFCFMMLQ